MSGIDWSKAPEWAGCVIKSSACGDDLYWCEKWGISGAKRCIFGKEDRPLRAWDLADITGKHAWVLIELRPTQCWSGDGLPPVGTVCEIAPPYRDHGTKVRVLCHDEGDAICRLIEGDEFGDLRQYMASELRPIRTPGQIAADERADTIDQMVQFFMNYYGNPKGAEQYLLICRSLHDAGYRKIAEPQ